MHLIVPGASTSQIPQKKVRGAPVPVAMTFSLFYCRKLRVIGEGTGNRHNLPRQWVHIVFKRDAFYNLYSFNNKPNGLHREKSDVQKSDVGRNEALVVIVSEFSLFNKLFWGEWTSLFCGGMLPNDELELREGESFEQTQCIVLSWKWWQF